jgi:probable F420-dependent oxidoreductase
MNDRKFRFGLVSGQTDTLDEWTRTARWAQDSGFDVLLSPDTPNVCSPWVALAAAAAATTTLRVGTFVLAAPMRTPGMTAWETASLDRLSGGRFELGVGAGRPAAEEEARLLGVPWLSPKERVAQVGDLIDAVRREFADRFAAADAATGQRFGGGGYLRPAQRPAPPVLVAGNGRGLLGVAARKADVVALGMGGSAGERELAEKVAVVRERAGDRIDDLELSLNIWGAGESTVPPALAGAFGLDLSQAKDNNAVAVLNGSPREIADVLLRRRDEFGVSYITVNSLAMTGFAPVVELLAGR